MAYFESCRLYRERDRTACTFTATNLTSRRTYTSIATMIPRPIRLALNLGFSPVELRRLQMLLTENENKLEEKWNEYFGA